jgi:hypothetical protein
MSRRRPAVVLAVCTIELVVMALMILVHDASLAIIYGALASLMATIPHMEPAE